MSRDFSLVRSKEAGSKLPDDSEAKEVNFQGILFLYERSNASSATN